MPHTSHAKVIDRIVAVVNDAGITQSELDSQWQRILDATPPGVATPARAAVLSQLIEQRLQQQRADELGVRAQRQDVDQAIQNVLADNAIPNLTALEQVLNQEGRTLADLRKEISTQITLMRVVQADITTHLKLGEPELLAYYQAHPAKFSPPGHIRVRQIRLSLTPPPPTDPAAWERMATALGESVTDHSSFLQTEARLAATPGVTVGSLGRFSPGDLRPELEQVLFSLEAGAVTPMLSLPNGRAMFLVDEAVREQTPPFETVHDQVFNAASNDATVQRLEAWITGLRQAAHIEIRSLDQGP